MKQREQFIAGLRDMADFLAANPEVPVPRTETIINVFVDRKGLANLARTLGKSEKSAVGDAYFYLRKSFGPFLLDFNVPREQVCTRRVVGKKLVEETVIPAHEEDIVEWDCQPILEVL